MAERYAHILGQTLMSPDDVSTICEEAAVTAARMDAYYRNWFGQMMAELVDNPSSQQAKVIASSLQDVQASVKGLQRLVDGIKRYGAIGGNGNAKD